MDKSLTPLLNYRKVAELIKFKNWRSPYATIAQKTGYSLSYVRRVLLGEEQLTSRFMGALIEISGLDPEDPKEWGDLFTWKTEDLKNHNHPAWNGDKFFARRPYSPLSIDYQFRKRDNPELEQMQFEGCR